MPPFEALYGRKCRSLLYWDDIEESRLIGPEILMQAVEKVKVVRSHLKAAQDIQRKWADMNRIPLQFEARDQVFLRISPTKEVIRFGVRGKLSLRYIGPFEIIE